MSDINKEDMPELFEEEAEISEGKTRTFAASDAESAVSAEAEEEAEPFSLDDMEALLKSVGLEDKKPKPKKEAEEQVKEYKPEKKDNADADDQHTKIIKTEQAEKNEKPKKDEPVSSHTRHYNVGKLFSQRDKNPFKKKVADDGQIILEGYSEDLPETVSEEDIEAKLKSRRKHFVDNFRVLAKPTQDKPILERISEEDGVRSLADSVVSEEGKGLFEAVDKANKAISARLAKQAAQREKAKENTENSKNLKKTIKTGVRKKTIRLEIMIGIAVASLIMSVIAAAYNPGGALEFLFGNGARIYTAVNLVLLFAGAVVSLEIFKKAINDLKKYRITSRVCIILISAFILLHGVISLIVGMNEESGFLSYVPFGLFIMSAELYSQLLNERTLFRNLSVMTKAENLVGLQRVDNKSDADVLAKQISRNDYPVIYYSADAFVPENPLEISESGRLDGRFYSIFTLVIMVIALALSVAVSIAEKKPSLIASCFTGCVCLCVPVLSRLVGELLHAKQVASAATFGGVITGIEACEELEQANAFVFDAQDIFEAKISKFRVVPRSLIAQSDAVIFAAATLKKTKSLLANCFDDHIAQNKISLPKAENVQYEDGLGYSSWVAGRRVLVGTRVMLAAHSIDCPTEEEEERYSKGRSVMYVVVEGIIVATFLVSYSVKNEVRKSVASFKNTGIIIMFCASEPCLSEAVAASKLGVDAASVKLVTSPGSEIISAYKEHSDDRVDNGLLCSKNKRNILALVCAAHSLCTAKHLSRVIGIIAAAVSFAFLAFCAFFSVTASFSSFAIIIIQCLWGVVSYYVGKSRLK